jgi:peptidoglycan L-alanyl-D-glutamate endopeptidase CwlK
MEDKITLDRIQLLHPKVRAEVEHIYKTQIVPLFGTRVICRFSHTLRTFQEQAELFKIGRTKLYDSSGKRLGKVTNANAGQSVHNYGLALDIVLLQDRNADRVYETASYDTVVDFDRDGKRDWMEVVEVLKRNGWTWGGDWTRFKDMPHFEKTFGLGWRDMKAKLDKKDFIPGTTYIRI